MAKRKKNLRHDRVQGGSITRGLKFIVNLPRDFVKNCYVICQELPRDFVKSI